MGPDRVRQSLERLIAHGRACAPHVLFAYANYPSTEYLEPANANFSAFNIYLEGEADFQSYLRRLHHIAGDRPLVVSEFGLDSRRNGLTSQAETLAWSVRTAPAGETAGLTLYAWSDRWWNEGAAVTNWDFGLTDRQGADKPALTAVRNALAEPSAHEPGPSFSVIVCTRNGRARISKCLRAVAALAGGPHECVVVDDGSTDGTADLVARNFPSVRLLRPCHPPDSAPRATQEPPPPRASGWRCRRRRLRTGRRMAVAPRPRLPERTPRGGGQAETSPTPAPIVAGSGRLRRWRAQPRHANRRRPSTCRVAIWWSRNPPSSGSEGSIPYSTPPATTWTSVRCFGDAATGWDSCLAHSSGTGGGHRLERFSGNKSAMAKPSDCCCANIPRGFPRTVARVGTVSSMAEARSAPMARRSSITAPWG